MSDMSDGKERAELEEDVEFVRSMMDAQNNLSDDQTNHSDAIDSPTNRDPGWFDPLVAFPPPSYASSVSHPAIVTASDIIARVPHVYYTGDEISDMSYYDFNAGLFASPPLAENDRGLTVDPFSCTSRGMYHGYPLGFERPTVSALAVASSSSSGGARSFTFRTLPLPLSPVPGIQYGVTPFISKLHYSLQSPSEYGDVLRWSEAKDSFSVSLKHPSFAARVLPHLFSHNSVSAFVHQLNTYDFERINSIAVAPSPPCPSLSSGSVAPYPMPSSLLWSSSSNAAPSNDWTRFRLADFTNQVDRLWSLKPRKVKRLTPGEKRKRRADADEDM